MSGFDNEKAVNIFFIESREMLQQMEDCLLDIEKGEVDDEFLNSIFRAAHTIKGSAGMFGFDPIEKFTHTVENLLDSVRNGEIQIESELVSLLLECNDHIETLLEYCETTDNSPLDNFLQTNGEGLLARLNEFMNIPDSGQEEDLPDICTDMEEPDSNPFFNTCWHISLRFRENLFRNSLDPSSFISYLSTLGDIINIVTLPDAIPSLQEINPESCYIGFEIDFHGNVSKEELMDVFEFVRDDCDIRILPPGSSIYEYVKLIEDLPETGVRIGEILKEVGSITESELEYALNMQKASLKNGDSENNPEPIGEIMVQEKIVSRPVLDAALEKQKKFQKKGSTIRVDSDKLDGLINLVGELVITGANVKQLSECESIDRSCLSEAVSDFSRLIENIRDSTMNIRMVQIGSTFKRFERTVRDLSREHGKEIDFIINGGETELDKTLIEKISDPLMHLVRNAVDHGIDVPEVREKKGKSRRGTIVLNAYNETGNIVIEINDDGSGLDRDRIFSKAKEKGFVLEEQIISDTDLFQLIFEPGFSTAEKVTNISGRGVGMDVVKRNIESLRGTVILHSEEGEGTSVRINLPLTLAIVDGFMFQVAGSFYVIPLDMVLECTEASLKDLNNKDGGDFINLRGELLPFMNMREFFQEDTGPEIASIIIVENSGKKAGLVVDKLSGEFQTVIKPVGELFRNLKWVTGATILGTGEVALILDVNNLISEASLKK